MLIIFCMMQKDILNYGIVLIYIFVKSLIVYLKLCSVVVSMSDSHPVDSGSISPFEPILFYFFPGLSQNFTKNQSWNERYVNFFRIAIKILTTRVLRKRSELKKIPWKIVQLNLMLNSILFISQLLNYRFSKVRPFLKSME